MEIPKLKPNQFGVGKAEYATGHVLRNDGTTIRNGQDLKEMFDVFESYEAAKEFVIQKVTANPTIECWIVNSKGEHRFTYDMNGERKSK